MVSHTSWVADCITLIHIYLILPKLQYGCEVHSFATEASIRISGPYSPYRCSPGNWSMLVLASSHLTCVASHGAMLVPYHRLPDSISCATVSHASHSDFSNTRTSLPKPFGYRVASVMSSLSVPALPVSLHQNLKIAYRQFPHVSNATQP